MSSKTFLNAKFVHGLYCTFLKAPPFCNLEMPDPDDVHAFVVDNKTIQGAAHKTKDVYQLQISKVNLEKFSSVFEVVLHEMVHLHFMYRGFKDHKHDAKFKRLANKVCDIYHLDRKTF